MTRGKDLVTAYSKVAVWEEDHAKVLPDEDGNRSIPSYVAFTETGRLLGQDAKDQVTFNPSSTIFNTKRLIGRCFRDRELQEDTTNTPFEILQKDGKPYYKVQYKNATKELAPEEVSAMVITKLRQIAESYLGATVTDAVISVPACFKDAQLQSTKDAGTIAGLNVLRIVKEPSAAALAYALNNNVADLKIILIFDLGASILDVTVVTIEEGIIEVMATAGNTHLGGQDFDNRLVDACVKECKRWRYKDISSDSYALLRLRAVCERAKRTLTSAKETTMVIDSLVKDIDFSATVTRAWFEELNKDLFESVLDPVRIVLRDAKLDKSNVDEIVLVGGSSRIPKIQQLLSDFFDGKELNTSLDADKVVAHGAAFLAAMLTRPIPPKPIKDVPFNNVNASVVTVSIFEGESNKQARDNNLLGNLTISNISLGSDEASKVNVSFDVDNNGLLDIIHEPPKGGKNWLKVKLVKDGLSKEEIKRMAMDAERYRVEDEADALISRRGPLSPIPD
ncbi:70-kilodalton heat shock protein [Mortierella sp. AD032]|nr:70-kilodalton heat shock protein [Mortierella sp. AD032]